MSFSPNLYSLMPPFELREIARTRESVVRDLPFRRPPASKQVSMCAPDDYSRSSDDSKYYEQVGSERRVRLRWGKLFETLLVRRDSPIQLKYGCPEGRGWR